MPHLFVSAAAARLEATIPTATSAIPNQPSGPNRKLYIAVAALAGLFVAVAIVVLLDMLNTRVRSVDDAVELLGVPVIGRFPVLKGGK